MLLFSSELGMAWVFLGMSLGPNSHNQEAPSERIILRNPCRGGQLLIRKCTKEEDPIMLVVRHFTKQTLTSGFKRKHRVPIVIVSNHLWNLVSQLVCLYMNL